ncbi:MAG TPA: phosphatase PAP2 family protein [Solirubrobacteraceae bacterium]|jgi:membrane-associated phospholipid phosphatase|nr:phosphatase PAP2 family protein [Solirubrobacteraceae bacterium]
MSSAPLTLTHGSARDGAGPSVRRSHGGNDRTWALRAVALCALAMAATWTLAELVPAVRWRDAVLLYDFGKLSRPGVDTLANHLLHLLDPGLYTVWALLLVAVALLRHRPRLAVAVAVVLPAAPGVAELLKPLLAHPHDSAGWEWIGPASWPSGHATAAMTLALCAVLVTPHRLRPLTAALGCAFAMAVACALLILAWHMPSDVLGGYLLAALCVSLTIVAMGPNWDRSGPLLRRRSA